MWRLICNAPGYHLLNSVVDPKLEGEVKVPAAVIGGS